MKCSTLNGNSVLHTQSTQFQDSRIIAEEVESLQEAEAVDVCKRTVFQTRQGSYIYEVTEVVTVGTRPARAQDRQKSQHINGGGKGVTKFHLYLRSYF